MKKLIPILLLLFSLNSFSQTYFPFPDSNTVWRETAVWGDIIANPPQTHSPFAYFLDGDTLINSNLYSKLYLFQCPLFYVFTPFPGPIPACVSIDTSNSVYFGALREVNKKVYFRPDTNTTYSFCQDLGVGPYTSSYNQDLLLFDFNVVVGDTVLYPHANNTEIVISSIDSILVQSQFRKRYNFDVIVGNFPACGMFFGNNYVEGIGDPIYGLFTIWTNYFENGTFLNCFQDNSVYYPDSTTCVSLPTVVQNNLINSSLSIYPNPSSSNLTIELINISTSFKAQVYINDITGREVYSSSISSAINNIDVSSFKSGLYLLKIISNNGEVKSSLVSIQ
jgi:hypothetical protein